MQYLYEFPLYECPRCETVLEPLYSKEGDETGYRILRHSSLPECTEKGKRFKITKPRVEVEEL